jgi:diaminopimelate decarboxylase
LSSRIDATGEVGAGATSDDAAERAGITPDPEPGLAAKLRDAARRFGTPLHVTDVATLDRAAADVRASFPDPWIRQYSVKANDVVAVVAEVTSRGFGANCVSRGEWAVARRAGVPNARVTLEGVGKTDADLRAAVRAAADGEPLRWIAVESAEEAERLTELARRAGLGRNGRPPLDVLVRLNPDVSPETLPGLAVGAGASKFGLTETEATGVVEWLGANAGDAVRARGIHLHVGSQLRAVDAWRDAVRRGLAVVGLLRPGSRAFDTLDVGGGFPVLPMGEPAPSAARFVRELPDLLDGVPGDRRPTRLAIEPGRALVARAGWVVARVLHVRDRGGPLVVIDGGMTEVIRPALYGARHPIVALTSGGRVVGDAGSGVVGELGAVALARTRVEGPICESTDTLGEHDLPPLRRGDLVAIADTGAYAASLTSTYNGRPRAPQVLIGMDGMIRRSGTGRR